MSLSNRVISNSGNPLPDGLSAFAGCPGKLGKYVLRRVIGRGGTGVVYEGEDTLLERPVAIKWVTRGAVQGTEQLAARDRLLREARWAARLNHPNTVTVYDAGEHDQGVYIAMELVRGQSAYDHLQCGRFTWREATRIVSEICRGLSAAHAAGLIHRDIKPANILLVDEARPATLPKGRSSSSARRALARSGGDAAGYRPWAKLSDFGLSRSLHYNVPVTVEGQVAGTPHYMSPEQIRGEPLDERADIYSLGATYYTLLTGRLPYERDDVI
jgi:serine/threonine protein kinase